MTEMGKGALTCMAAAPFWNGSADDPVGIGDPDLSVGVFEVFMPPSQLRLFRGGGGRGGSLDISGGINKIRGSV